MLRTRAPLVVANPFDLHVLGPPQTFALSQDQTLQFDVWLVDFFEADSSRPRPGPTGRVTGASPLGLALPQALLCRSDARSDSSRSPLPLSSFQGALDRVGSPTCRGRGDLVSVARLVKLSWRDFLHTVGPSEETLSGRPGPVAQGGGV